LLLLPPPSSPSTRCNLLGISAHHRRHAGLLWSLAPQLAIFLLVYSLGGTFITAAGFGRRLMRLTYSVLQREADLRFALVSLRACTTAVHARPKVVQGCSMAGLDWRSQNIEICGARAWPCLLGLSMAPLSCARLLVTCDSR
jgi:hypothetical protein